MTSSLVYAVTHASAPRFDEVDLVRHRELAAVTSPLGQAELRARRRDLLRHAEVVQHAFEHAAVVPFAFGTVVDDVVADLLEPRHDELLQLLRQLEGLAELTVRVVFREDDVLRVLLREQPHLERLRRNAAPVVLGEAVARAIAARRDAVADDIVAALRPHVRATAFDDLRTTLDVLRGAFLVERRRVPDADAALDQIGREHAATATFKVTGPLPPHHFVALAGAA